MALTLTGLRCLVAIVDADLNVSAASEVLHLTQPCVSRHLKQIEDALGFRVFTRRGRNLDDVTPAGREAVATARRIVRDVDGLRSYAANATGEVPGELCIAAPQTYARHVLPPVLRRLRERYPGLSVSLRSLGEGERVRPADHQQCDAVVVSTAGEEIPAGVAIPLFRWKRVVIVSHDHPLARQPPPVSLAQLAAWPLVTYESSRRPGSSLMQALSGAGLRPQFSCSAHDAGTLKAYARAGLGVGLVAELSLGPADTDDFTILPADPALPDCTAWAVLPDHRVPCNATLELIRLLAPQIDAADLRRAVQGMPPAEWPVPPIYTADSHAPPERTEPVAHTG